MKRRIVLIASLVAGIVAAVLTRIYIVSKDAEAEAVKAAFRNRYGTMFVVCLKHDAPSGTVLAKSDLRLKEVPRTGVEGHAIAEEDASAVFGRKLLVGHRENETLFWADIEGGNPAAGGLSESVKRQMRAVSINCSGAASVSGMVRPNDHVDVIGTFDLADGAAGGDRKKAFVTSTILQNVLVLATGSRTAKMRVRDAGPSGAYQTVTLEVTPREAEMLAFAEQMKGRLVLSLRNRNDTSFEKELPAVDYEKIRGEIEELNLKRQQQKLIGR